MKRLSATERISIILDAGVRLANQNGLCAATHDDIAAAIDAPPTSTATVRWYFRRKDDLWKAIASHPQASREVKTAAKALRVL